MEAPAFVTPCTTTVTQQEVTTQKRKKALQLREESIKRQKQAELMAKHVTGADVVITTAAGTFSCTYIAITDEKDGVHSWELWYNETVQNYVKIVDRLPGSHSDSVVYELTGYDRPSTPQFLTEAGKQSASSFELQWAEFPGAQAYQLMENGVEVYRGDSTTFNARNRADGDYLYQINAIMGLDYVLPGTQIEVNVNFVPPLPEVAVNPETIPHDGEVTVSWSYPFEAEWYALTVQSPDGTTTEMYNGSSDFVEIGELEPGLNRIRVSAMVNGKLGDNAKKRELLERTLAIFESAYGTDHPHTKLCQEELAKL